MQTLLDIKMTAKRLARTENAVRRMIGRKQLPYHRCGVRIFIVESELDAFIDRLSGRTLAEIAQGDEAHTNV